MCKVKTIINNQIQNLEVEYKIIIKKEKNKMLEVSDTYEDNEEAEFQENLSALYFFLGQAEEMEDLLVVNNLVIPVSQFCETVDDGTVRLENAKMIKTNEAEDRFFIIDELDRYYSVENL